MRYTITENSHIGGILIGIELAITMFFFNSWLKTLSITIHPAIRLIICLLTWFVAFSIFNLSKIICYIISVAYTIIWTVLAYEITDGITNGDNIWSIVIGAFTFFIIIVLHIGSFYDSGYDYEINADDN